MISQANTACRHGPPERPGIQERVRVEIHFGKPVVARVRKCRTVVVKNKRLINEDRK